MNLNNFKIKLKNLIKIKKELSYDNNLTLYGLIYNLCNNKNFVNNNNLYEKFQLLSNSIFENSENNNDYPNYNLLVGGNDYKNKKDKKDNNNKNYKNEIIKLLNIKDITDSKNAYNVLYEYIKQEYKLDNYKDILQKMIEFLKSNTNKKKFIKEMSSYIDNLGGIDKINKKLNKEKYNRCISKCQPIKN